jgi:thiol-disulfide isomerase/thioredoxin
MRTFTLSVFIFLTALSPGLRGQNRSIQFTQKPWLELLAQAKSENRLIFVDAYATWCGPCKWMSANIFTNDSVADFYNRNFLCTQIDMEKGEGPNLAMQFQVSAYPTLLFVSPDGGLVHRKVGASKVIADYITLGKEALSPDQNLAFYVKKYNAGNRSTSFMEVYLNKLSDAYIPVDQPLDSYFTTQVDDSLLNRANWNMIVKYLTDLDSPVFLFLLKHEKEYAARYTEDSVYLEVNSLFEKYIRSSVRDPGFGYDQLKDKQLLVSASGFSRAAQVNLRAELQFDQFRGDIPTYLELARRDAATMFATDPDMLQNISYTVLKMTQDSVYLKAATEWMTTALKQNNNPVGNVILSNLFSRIGDQENAIVRANEALNLAKQQGLPLKDYEENLRRVQEYKPGSN